MKRASLAATRGKTDVAGDRALWLRCGHVIKTQDLMWLVVRRDK